MPAQARTLDTRGKFPHSSKHRQLPERFRIDGVVLFGHEMMEGIEQLFGLLHGFSLENGCHDRSRRLGNSTATAGKFYVVYHSVLYGKRDIDLVAAQRIKSLGSAVCAL